MTTKGPCGLFIKEIHLNKQKTIAMKKNVGPLDRVIRIVIAAILAILYFSGVVTGTTGTIFLILALILLITAAFKICGLYSLVGMNTCKKEAEE